jgi:hypothetical protein
VNAPRVSVGQASALDQVDSYQAEGGKAEREYAEERQVRTGYESQLSGEAQEDLREVLGVVVADNPSGGAE